MNDIENEIEKDFEKDDSSKKEERKENDTIKRKINNYPDNNNKKKIVIIAIIGIVLLLLGALVLYFVLNNKEKTGNDDSNKDKIAEKAEKEDTTIPENAGYVSCDDNTSPLNVRNSTSGDIIDSLSCFKQVTIEEELENTDNCAKWYKISYEKNNSNYTGYACGTYIKKQAVDNSTIKKVNNLFEKANEYFNEIQLFTYCGETSGTKIIDFVDNDTSVKGEYLKSKYKSLSELKNYLLSFLNEDLLSNELKLGDINNPKYYDNYYEIDGNLYCRHYTGKGYTTRYTKNYDIEVVSSTDTKITANVAYEYLKENSKCEMTSLSSCSNSNFEYKIGKMIIEEENGNLIVSKLEHHD